MLETRHDHPRGVDTHAHIFTQQLPFVRAGEGYIPDYDATLETYLQKVSEHRLSHGVLIQPSFLGNDNSHLLKATAAHPETLRGVVIADPDMPMEALQSMSAQGAVGTRVILYGSDPTQFASSRWRTFAKQMVELDWLIEIYGDASDLRDVCEPFLNEGCRLLIDHYGRPNPTTNVADPGFRYLLSLATTAHVWVDVSGPYRNGTSEVAYELSRHYFSILKEQFGLTRMLWGSDWPCVQFESTANYTGSLKYLDRLGLTDEERDQLLWQTPSALFGFSSDSACV